LESVTKPVTFSADAAATAINYRLDTPFGTAPAFTLLITDLPESADPPRTDDAPRALNFPAGVTGVLDRRFRDDRYEFAAKKGEVWSIALDARRIGSPLDAAFSVLGPDGRELAQSDDLPGTTDAGLDFTAPADGLFRVVVSDRSGKSGSRDAVYRLQIHQPAADFQLQMLQRLNVLIGGKLDVVVKARRIGGFKGPIELIVAGLPPGITVPAGLVIPADKAELAIPLVAAPEAVASAALVTVTGTARIGEASVTRVAMCPAAGSLVPRTPYENDVPKLLVTSMMRPRVKGRPVDQDTIRRVNRGTTFPADVIVERLEGFTGEIVLKQSAKQSYQVQGITGGEVKVPPGVERTTFPCFMPEWLETSRTSRMGMIAVVQVRDPSGKIRHLVAEMTGFITMSMEGALLKLSHTSRDLVARPGEPFDVHLRLTRSPKLPEPARVDLNLSEDQASLFAAEPVTLLPGQEEVDFRVTPAAGPRLAGLQALVIRARVLQDGHLPAISETHVDVEFSTAEK
ncbi:MAG: PPC domain-containing protein, partial [Deltaproteobacteria bacterium]